MKENILITGGAGFIGSHTVELINERDKYNIVILDDLSTGKLSNLENLKYTFIQGDILDLNLLDNIFHKYRFKYVIHLAAQVSVGKSCVNPKLDADLNIIGTINILELSKKYSVNKIIFSSSAAVYGVPKYLPIDESHDISPLSFYGLSKYTCENYIKMYSKMYGLNYIIYRYANVYGERQDSNGEAGVVSIFYDNMKLNNPITIHGDGLQTRDFISVKDIAKANFLGIEKNVYNEIINIGTNNETNLIELVSIIEKSNNYKFNVKYIETRTGDIKNSCLNTDKMFKLLDYKADKINKIKW
ncbi:MAG: NAD-dependent epimerase/dehydratase family protein [Fusobacteria bacterium]|nr:NAD-dependent epimerase/dehydratase family protein [Fusobacteriota bacterium]